MLKNQIKSILGESNNDMNSPDGESASTSQNFNKFKTEDQEHPLASTSSQEIDCTPDEDQNYQSELMIMIKKDNIE